MLVFTAEERSALVPNGMLRATINLGNPILAKLREGASSPEGVSVDLAHALAQSLGVPLELVVLDAAGKAVSTVVAELADVGFFAVDPVRGRGIRFTAPYVLIEGAYLVRDTSPIQANEEVDRAGIRVAVGNGSAYDLYLTRELSRAEIVRAPTSPAVVDTFQELQLDVAAGVKQQLEFDAKRLGGLRLLPGRFMVIEQAMGVPLSRGDLAATALARFVEHAKSSGFVADAIEKHGVAGASVAP